MILQIQSACLQIRQIIDKWNLSPQQIRTIFKTVLTTKRSQEQQVEVVFQQDHDLNDLKLIIPKIIKPKKKQRNDVAVQSEDTMVLIKSQWKQYENNRKLYQFQKEKNDNTLWLLQFEQKKRKEVEDKLKQKDNQIQQKDESLRKVKQQMQERQKQFKMIRQQCEKISEEKMLKINKQSQLQLGQNAPKQQKKHQKRIKKDKLRICFKQIYDCINRILSSLQKAYTHLIVLLQGTSKQIYAHIVYSKAIKMLYSHINQAASKRDIDTSIDSMLTVTGLVICKVEQFDRMLIIKDNEVNWPSHSILFDTFSK